MCSVKRSIKRKLLFDFLNRQKLNVAAFASGLKLNARVFRVSPVADDRRLIALRRLLHGENRLAVILFGEGLALEHKVFGGFYAALDDNLVRRLADYLNKYIFYVAHICSILS